MPTPMNAMYTPRMVTAYILSCIRIGVKPWQYFQLNSSYFNDAKRIYSKLDIDQYIPDQWRLQQSLIDDVDPLDFPVFIKPEWGQNSYGIQRIDNRNEFDALDIDSLKGDTLVQQAAPGKHEYEIFYIRSVDHNQPAVLKVIETKNDQSSAYPINGIFNPNTYYFDRSDGLTESELENIWSMLGKIGHFRFARVCLRADSMAAFLASAFHIVEINLFAPMPLNLLARNASPEINSAFIRQAMRALARITKTIPREQKSKNVFRNTIAMHYKVKP